MTSGTVLSAMYSIGSSSRPKACMAGALRVLVLIIANIYIILSIYMAVLAVLEQRHDCCGHSLLKKFLHSPFVIPPLRCPPGMMRTCPAKYSTGSCNNLTRKYNCHAPICLFLLCNVHPGATRARPATCIWIMYRVGQNCIYTPYMTVYLMISLPKVPYLHRIYRRFTITSEIK